MSAEFGKRRVHASAHALLLVSCLALGMSDAALAAANDGILRVCADPANLPLSNDKGEGYENKIAEALAHDLNRKVEYTFFPQRMGFIRNTLRLKDEKTQQYKCDLIMGVPSGYEMAATTRPYLHSTYALVFATRNDLDAVRTADDILKLSPEALAKLRIGVFTKSPGADWLLKHSMIDHAAVYTHQNGDVDESPAKTIERDLAAGKIDAAILWGPIAGMLVSQHKGGVKWRTVPFVSDPPIKFDYEISMGVRNGEKEWKDTVDAWIAGHQKQIDSILLSYQVPLVDATGHLSSIAKDGSL